MAFKEELLKSVEKIEDEALRATIINELDQAHALDVGGLKDTNGKLKNEKLLIQEELKDRDKKLASFEGLEGKSLADFQKQEKTIAELLSNPGDNDKIVKELTNKNELQLKQEQEKYQSYMRAKDLELDEQNKKISMLDEEINRGLSQNELTQALERANVKPELKPMLARALQNDIYVDVDALGNRKVMFKHKDINFGIKEGISTWAGAPENQTFIAALKNVGTGAQGSRGTGSGQRKAFKDMSPEEVNTFYREDPEGFKLAKAKLYK